MAYHLILISVVQAIPILLTMIRINFFYKRYFDRLTFSLRETNHFSRSFFFYLFCTNWTNKPQIKHFLFSRSEKLYTNQQLHHVIGKSNYRQLLQNIAVECWPIQMISLIQPSLDTFNCEHSLSLIEQQCSIFANCY